MDKFWVFSYSVDEKVSYSMVTLFSTLSLDGRLH